MSKEWYVIHTYSGYEANVKKDIEKYIELNNLQEYFGEIIIPTHNVLTMKKGQKKITRSKSFPSYIVINMEMNNETKYLVLNVTGVMRFLGTGNEPQPLSKEEIDNILKMQQEVEEKPTKQEIEYKYGDIVTIIDGPFKDFTGTIEEANSEKGRLKVIVSIFGRPTPVDVDFLQVELVKTKKK